MDSKPKLNSIDLAAMPKWDFSVRVRGMELPMISPQDAPEINEAPVPTQAQLDARTKRWPGLFVWLWRAIFGGPRIDVKDLPTDGGAAHTRNICTIILGDAYADLVSELKHAECVQIFSTYMAAQEEWIHACSLHARERFSEHLRRQSPQPAQDAPKAGGMVELKPGEPYPFEARLNPLIYNDDGSKRE